MELTLTLARTEFKLRYFGSVLGYVWSLMRPLLFFGVLYVFFTQIVDIGKQPHYGVYLLTGIVFWNYFSEATGNCVNCLIAREALLRKIRFPRMVVPVSVSLTATFNLVLNFLAVFVFALLNGLTPTLKWLELIPIALAVHHAGHRAGDAAIGDVRAVPRRAADLGGDRAGVVLLHADHVHGRGV